MRKTPKLIVFIGIILISLMGAFPPWAQVDEDKVTHPMGYAPIWAPPVQRQQNSAEIFGIKLKLDLQTKTANTIDWPRLLMQIAIVSALTGGAVVFLRLER